HASTTDDTTAIRIATSSGIEASSDDGGIRLAATEHDLDTITIALAHHGIGLNTLVPAELPLHALFAQLTAGGEVPPAPAAEATPLPTGEATNPPSRTPGGEAPPGFVRDVFAVCRVEVAKLVHQWPARLLALVCVLAPFVFAAGVSLSGS